MNRTHTNGELRRSDEGKYVTLCGWVAKRRNLGSIVFIDLRDRYGITQITFDEKMTDMIKDVRNEYVIEVSGTVAIKEVPNPKLPTGEIEVRADKFTLINEAKTTPMIIADETDALEDIRLKYRYLDLRRNPIKDKLLLRDKVTSIFRNYLHDLNFIEVETPILSKSTPEGARDYLVPSRLYHGRFYALPQSPQIYKQLLMIGGIDRYFKRLILSDEIGITKPDRRLFDYALQLVGAEPSDTLIVGDNYDADILGAMNAGWGTIYFNRDNLPVTGLQPDYVVTALSDIKQIL